MMQVDLLNQSAGSVNDPLSRFAALDVERRELEARLEKIKEEQAALQEAILDEWSTRGQHSASVNGLMVYVAADFWCNKKPGVPTEEVCRRLEAIGKTDLVGASYNAQALKAWIKAQRAEAEDGTEVFQVPDEIAEVVQWGEVPRLRTRKL